MPVRLDPNNTGQRREIVSTVLEASYDYDYPRDLDLKPGSEFHEKLRSRIYERFHGSYRVMNQRYDEWQERDKTLKAYVPVEKNALRDTRGEREDDDPLERIIMPVTFSNLETLLTYMTSAFLLDPIFTYEGTGPEDTYGAFLLTQHVAHQTRRAKLGLNLHTWWRDAFCYGFGVMHPTWERIYGKRVVREESGFLDSIRNLFTVTDQRRKVEKGVLHEGAKVHNIDPYRYFPDPAVSIHETQDAEYHAWLDDDTLMNLLRRERDSEDFLFNVRYLKHLGGGGHVISVFNSTREDELKATGKTVGTSNPIDVGFMFIDLIPEEWELGRGQYPEKWLFMVAADQVIIAAQPLNLHHGMLPVVTCAPDFDGYSTIPTSRLEITSDLQNITDFLFSAHIMNLRRAINDVIVVDPSMINYYDVINPRPGKVIRTRKSTWGRGGIDASIQQLRVNDVTQGHVSDAAFVMGFMQEVLGTTENLKGGIVRRGERISATEISGARVSGLARLERIARIISMQGMDDLAYMLAYHTQQFANEEQYVKVLGEYPERVKATLMEEPDGERVLIDPMDMLIGVDVVSHDGTIPGSENAETWINILQVASQSPEIVANLNIPRLFMHIARHMGAKNPEDFVKKQPQAQVTPDDTVLREAEAGNIIPLGDGAPL